MTRFQLTYFLAPFILKHFCFLGFTSDRSRLEHRCSRLPQSGTMLCSSAGHCVRSGPECPGRRGLSSGCVGPSVLGWDWNKSWYCTRPPRASWGFGFCPCLAWVNKHSNKWNQTFIRVASVFTHSVIYSQIHSWVYSRPVPRRQRSAVDVPVSFSQAGDLRGERQHGVTFSCRFSFNLGVSDPQCTATYLNIQDYQQVTILGFTKCNYFNHFYIFSAYIYVFQSFLSILSLFETSFSGFNF